VIAAAIFSMLVVGRASKVSPTYPPDLPRVRWG
jgi:hypothetical protein